MTLVSKSHLRVVGPGDLPPPLLPPDVELEMLPDVLLNRKWLCDSQYSRSATREERLAAILLRACSIDEKPAGTLPDDDRELAALSGYGDNVQAWLKVKDKATEGWTLCSDGRLYLPDMAARTLKSWITRLTSQLKQARGEATKKHAKLVKERKTNATEPDFNPDPFERPLAAAKQALYALEPRAVLLRGWVNPIVEVEPEVNPETGEVAQGEHSVQHSEPHSVSHKRREEKQSESENYISPTAQAVGARSPEEDSGGRDGSAPPPNIPKRDIQPYPGDGFEQFWELFPRKVKKLDAEEAFREVSGSRPVNFEALMSAVLRYVTCKPSGNDWAYPASWLRDKRWTDVWPDPRPVSVPTRGARPSGPQFRGGPPGKPFQPTSFRGR